MITIYTAEHSPRLSYIISELITSRLGLKPLLTTDVNAYQQASGIKINYSHNPLLDGLHIIPQGLLFELEVKSLTPEVKPHADWYFTLWENNQPEVPFDVFSAAFYLLSRYEEYTCANRDEHDRFCAKDSLAFVYGFLEIPLVDMWCNQLKQVVLKQQPDIGFARHTFKKITTIDVDLAFKYKGLGLTKWLGKLMKNFVKGQLGEVKFQLQSTLNSEIDPYNTYGFIRKNCQHTLGYFLLMRSNGTFDRNIHPNRSIFRKLVTQLRNESDFMGIHPSYQSNNKPGLLKEELDLLQTQLGNAITRSRQHYLKVKLPNTYQNLTQVGIKVDYSLFYAEAPGFRASTCFPFTFYNLQENIFTSLTIMPTCVMDTTLEHYQKLPPESWIVLLKRLEKTVEEHEGYYISLWHNNMFERDEVKKVFIAHCN